MRRVQEELDSVVGQQRLVQEDDLPNLKYLSAVVSETLRLHSPGPFLVPRESTQDCEIQGFHIPAKTRVMANYWAIHRDPAVWDRPLEFDPDRFVNSKIEFTGQDFKFLPFGSGRRICPGINLGALMVLSPLALLLHAADWKTVEGQKPEELDISETFGLVLYKRLPLILYGKARLPNHVIYPAQQA
jgi:cytochrome P450